MKLEVRNLGFRYVPHRDIFHAVSFSLRSGDVLSILGGNGAGKSTLLNCIAGLSTPFAGEILVDGAPISAMTRAETAHCIGYIPQIHSSSFGYSVLEYVVMGRTPYIGAFRQPSPEDYRIAAERLELVGMAHKAECIITELSGGEQQLAAIARVLTQEAAIILLDEPTNHLDYGNQYRLLEVLRGLAKQGYLIITTTHDPTHALHLGGKAAVLTPGQSLALGESAEILTEQRLTSLYGLPIGLIHGENLQSPLCYVR